MDGTACIDLRSIASAPTNFTGNLVVAVKSFDVYHRKSHPAVIIAFGFAQPHGKIEPPGSFTMAIPSGNMPISIASSAEIDFVNVMLMAKPLLLLYDCI